MRDRLQTIFLGCLVFLLLPCFGDNASAQSSQEAHVVVLDANAPEEDANLELVESTEFGAILVDSQTGATLLDANQRPGALGRFDQEDSPSLTPELKDWSVSNPQLMEKLRSLLTRGGAVLAGGTSNDTGSLTKRTDAWLWANRDRLSQLEGVSLEGEDDKLIALLNLRRGLVQTATKPMSQTADSIDQKGILTTAYEGAKALLWSAFYKISGSIWGD